jgi:hypothetical protein
LAASKLMAPSRIASSAAAATIVSEKLHQPQRADELAFAAIAHAGFQPPQML